MSEVFQVVPWYNVKEWMEVYDNIYATTATLITKKNALNQLMIWKARCPSLPSGIESSLSLLYVYIQDQQGYCHDVSNDHLLCLAYSSALMRFVNHMLDKQTAKGLSLYQAAKTLGVPEWIIELRHDTAHGDRLPRLELLREAYDISLKWLQKNYWDKHKLCITDFIVGKVHNTTDIENKLTALMNFCVSLSICSHPKCNVKYLDEIKDANLRECLVADARELLDERLDFSDLKNVSIATLKQSFHNQAKKVLNDDSYSTFINKALLSEHSVLMSLELYKLLDNFGYCNNRLLNRDYVQCFDGLLSFLFTYDLLKDFILELIKETQCEDEQNAKKCMLAAKWVSVILKALRKNQQFREKLNKSGINIKFKEKKDVKSLYYHWYPNDKHRTLLLDMHKPVPKEFTNLNFIQPIISTYNPYLVFFMNDLLNLVRPRLPIPVISKICQLAQVIASPEKFPVSSSKIYTADDLQAANSLDHVDESKHDEDMEIIEVDEDNQESDSICKQTFGIWQVSSKNHEWATCPIGRLPWTQVQSMEI